jgi:pimeloyl-ACP methyl ester carboxylesterase
MSADTTPRASGDAETDDLPDGVPGEARYRTVGGRRFHVVEAGPPDGELVVLLHGFPEFWYGWRDQIAPVVEAGYRVAVPDQRGYNRSAKPRSVSAYRIHNLAADVSGLIEAYDRDSAHVVGHDWGGVVGWWLAIHDPERVDRLVTANAPHPTVIRRTLRRDPAQLARTSYALAFQLPALPEAASRAFGWRLPRTMMRRTAMPGTFDAADFRRYRAAWERDGAFTTMLHWYRANGRSVPRPEADEVEVPTRVIWGAGDRFLHQRMAHDSLDYCSDGRLTLLEEGTHWLQHDVPVKVADAILDELGGIAGNRNSLRRPD